MPLKVQLCTQAHNTREYLHANKHTCTHTLNIGELSTIYRGPLSCQVCPSPACRWEDEWPVDKLLFLPNWTRRIRPVARTAATARLIATAPLVFSSGASSRFGFSVVGPSTTFDAGLKIGGRGELVCSGRPTIPPCCATRGVIPTRSDDSSCTLCRRDASSSRILSRSVSSSSRFAFSAERLSFSSTTSSFHKTERNRREEET